MVDCGLSEQTEPIEPTNERLERTARSMLVHQLISQYTTVQFIGVAQKLINSYMHIQVLYSNNG
jgi:hypothetical protein